MGTKMNEKDFPFKVGNEEYALWMWKGNYWNLHSGAEIGLYKYDRTHAGTKHYDAIDFEVPMRLSLYRYSNSGKRYLTGIHMVVNGGLQDLVEIILNSEIQIVITWQLLGMLIYQNI